MHSHIACPSCAWSRGVPSTASFLSSIMQDKHDSSSLADSEKHAVEIHEKASTSSLALDRHGLPLVPQPTRFKDDPLARHSIVEFMKKELVLTKTPRIGLHG